MIAFLKEEQGLISRLQCLVMGMVMGFGAAVVAQGENGGLPQISDATSGGFAGALVEPYDRFKEDLATIVTTMEKNS